MLLSETMLKKSVFISDYETARLEVGEAEGTIDEEEQKKKEYRLAGITALQFSCDLMHRYDKVREIFNYSMEELKALTSIARRDRSIFLRSNPEFKNKTTLSRNLYTEALVEWWIDVIHRQRMEQKSAEPPAEFKEDAFFSCVGEEQDFKNCLF